MNNTTSLNSEFVSILEEWPWARVTELIYNSTVEDVVRALRCSKPTVSQFAALLSPAADTMLEELAQKSSRVTRSRFGNTIQLYAPMYLSNECTNICTYCGFSFNNKVPRITLNDEQLKTEISHIKALGFDHILLVTGEDAKHVGVDYLANALRIVSPHFSSVSIEVQPLEEKDYRTLIDNGLNSVLVYQETYNRSTYRDFHLKGKKSNFNYRLDTPDRLGRAGIHKIGLGVLLGLSDWRVDSFFVGLHLEYLRRTFWKTKFSISFPRLRPAEGAITPPYEVTDRDLVHLISAYRIFDENIELSISTREPAALRDNIIKLGVTTMSAGSKTDPGGYGTVKDALKQFEISDERSPQEVADMITEAGMEPVWKDWDRVYSNP